MTKEYTFYIGLFNNHTAKCQETVEIEFNGDETEDEVEEIVKEEFDAWLSNNTEMSWWTD